MPALEVGGRWSPQAAEFQSRARTVPAATLSQVLLFHLHGSGGEVGVCRVLAHIMVRSRSEDMVEVRALGLARLGRCGPSRPQGRAGHSPLHGNRKHSQPTSAAPRPMSLQRARTDAHKGPGAAAALMHSTPPNLGAQEEERLRAASCQLRVRDAFAPLGEPQGGSVMRRRAGLGEARARHRRNAKRRRAVDHEIQAAARGRLAQWCVSSGCECAMVRAASHVASRSGPSPRHG